MTTNAPADLRYPIGTFKAVLPVTHELRGAAIDAIEGFPARLREAVTDLSDAQLDTPYRPEGWTVRQVVHHTADSHAHAYIRLKFALSEDNPTIKPYAEAVWAEMRDARSAPVSWSLDLLEALHGRLMLVLGSLDAAAFARTLYHPERGPLSIDDYLALYDWHSRHHTAHITSLRARSGW